MYTSEDTHANILSFSEVEDKYNITYVPQEAFIVHLPDRDVRFERKGKMYVVDWTKSLAAFELSLVFRGESLGRWPA